MEIDLKKIIKAWSIAANPSDKQQELALKRLEICNPCEKRSQTWISTTCSACGCPISKKIYTDEFNECPLGKWEKVDLDSKLFNTKTEKTLF